MTREAGWSEEALLAQGDWMRALARHLTRDAAMAADLEQETFLAALTRAPGARRDLRGWLDRAAYIPQAPYLLDATILRNIVFGTPAERIDIARVERAIDKAQLREMVDALPEGIRTEVGERGVRLSGGQRQRLAIARALYQGREFLILDEATSALDEDTERDVLRAVRALHGRTTLLVIAHSERTLAVCDRIERLHIEAAATVGASGSRAA